MKLTSLGICALAAAVSASGCGSYVREGRGPTTAVVTSVQAAPGVSPSEFGGTLNSDVVTYVKKTVNGVEVRVPTIFNDVGKAQINVDLKNPALTEPSTVNQVTFTRYRVEFIRADGRNAQGIDIPYSFDSAVTVTSSPETPGVVGFELVRHTAKSEAPLVALANNLQMISTIAKITFYGKDHAGNDVTAIGQLGITFGNFGDPD